MNILEKFIKPKYETKLYKKYGVCHELKKYNIKLLFITDTHGLLAYEKELIDYIENLKDEDYACCILLGDHSVNDIKLIKSMIPNEKLFGVLGNHDSVKLYEEYSIKDINGKIINIKGVKIAGIGGSYKYKDSNEYALYTHEESINLANNMDEADILISHDTPYIGEKYGVSHDGLKGITEYIYKNHIPLHVHGHLHEENEEILMNGTKSVCLYKIKLLEI